MDSRFLLHLICTDKCGLCFCTGVVGALRDMGLLQQCDVCVSGGMANVLLYHLAVLTKNTSVDDEKENNWYAFSVSPLAMKEPVPDYLDPMDQLLWPRIKQFCVANHEFSMMIQRVTRPYMWCRSWVTSPDLFFPDVPDAGTLGDIQRQSNLPFCFTGYSEGTGYPVCITTDATCPVTSMTCVRALEWGDRLPLQNAVCAMSVPSQNNFDETVLVSADLALRNAEREDLALPDIAHSYLSKGVSNVLLVDGSSNMPHFKNLHERVKIRLRKYTSDLLANAATAEPDEKSAVVSTPVAFRGCTLQMIDQTGTDSAEAIHWVNEIQENETRLEQVTMDMASKLYVWGYLLCVKTYTLSLKQKLACVNKIKERFGELVVPFLRILGIEEDHHDDGDRE